MTYKAYGYDPLTLLDILKRGIDEEHERRRRTAKPLSQAAEEARQEVLEKVNEFIGGNPLDRRVLKSLILSSNGCIVKLEDEKSHVLVSEDVAEFYSPTTNYQAFREYNPNTRVTPRDLFMNVVAHELGHIILAERIGKSLSYALATYNASPFQTISLEADEGFAFWFGDTVTGFKSPLQEHSIGYQRRGIQFEKSIAIYQDLGRLTKKEGKDATLNPNKLREIFQKHKKPTATYF